MPRKAADAVAVDIVKVLTDAVERIAVEKVAAQTEAVTQSIIENMPEVVALPPKPADVPEERLLSVKQIAAMLGCSLRSVQLRYRTIM